MLLLLSLLYSLPAEALTPEQKNRNLDPLPPKVLYHVGQKKHLLEDAALNTIPDSVWEKNVMGRDTRFGLVPYRRGFYGGANFDSLELFGNKYYGGGEGGRKTPWVMKITLKEECRKPEAVSDLASDPKYLHWVLANGNYLVRHASFCLNLKSRDCTDLITGTQPIAGGREENLCDDLMQKFMREVNPRVARDTEWDSSWYLRDRSCIEKLEADPRTVLGILAGAGWSWESRLRHYDPAVNGYGTFAFGLLVDALASSEEPPPAALLARLRAKVAASDIRAGRNQQEALWLRESGAAVIDAYTRCQAGSNLAAFRGIASRLADDLASREMTGMGSYAPGPQESPGTRYRKNQLITATKAFTEACR